MTVVTFIKDTITIHRSGVSFSADLGELAAKDLLNQLLEKYPVEPEATPVAGPLREVTLAEARPGDIATFEIKPLPAKGKFVCTLKKSGNGKTLCADKWLTANTIPAPAWYIRSYRGMAAGGMKDLHIWRWDGVDETAELPEEPTVAGWYHGIMRCGRGLYRTQGNTYIWNDGSDEFPWEILESSYGPMNDQGLLSILRDSDFPVVSVLPVDLTDEV
ncbi:hypothetical protein [uncultured Bifidobacterium sp.]|uniref:hypothetical protein n=1 Tax=uncultured Bifidobacterium sp. TaxID=165187 RepID=UPI0025913085|nr:hypothetical protein [uncultured Bifidobacterium sp.]